MKFNSRSYVATYSLLVWLLVLVGILRIVSHYIDNNLFDTMEFVTISMYFMALVMVWAVSIKRRILNNAFKRQFILIAFFLFSFLLVKFIRYGFTEDPLLSRILWYLYYPPIIILPLNVLFASFYLGRREDYHINRLYYLLYIPAYALSLLVITNDHHQLVFHFIDDDYTNWAADFIPNVFYYVIVAWIIVIFSVALLIITNRCANTKMKKWAFVPFIILGSCLIWCFIFMLFEKYGIPVPYSFPDYFTVSVVLFLESLIQVNLVRTNVGYVNFYKRSDLVSVITDLNHNVIYKTEQSDILTPDFLNRVFDGEQIINDKWKITLVPIKQGYLVMADDISYISVLEDELKDIGVTLAEKNEIIEAESELREKKLKIDTQDEIYNKINEFVKNDIKHVSELINNLDTKSDDFNKHLTKALISISYIKRRINLFLIMYTEKVLPSKELGYSINELLSYVKLAGIDASYSFEDISEGGEDAIIIFERIYQIIEYYLDIADSIFIKMCLEDGIKTARFLIDHSTPRPFVNKLAEYEYDGTTSIITFKGGLLNGKS